jgi:RNA polymerase sigma-70 factor (ECF subfamily)
MTEQQERALLDGCRQGDASCWEQLYHSHRREVLYALTRVLGPCAELEDLVQIVFIRVHRRLSSFEERSRFSTWLRGICTYVALEFIKKRKRSREVPDDNLADRVSDPGADPWKLAARKQMRERFHQCLAKVKSKKRNVLVMHDLLEIPTHEIAWMLDVPPATVRTRLFHARKEMARRMSRAAHGGRS